MIPSTLRELARITELEDKVKILERDHDNAVNVVYQASLKTAAIQRLFSDIEGSSLFEDLEAIEAYVRTAATTIADERERNQALVTELTRYRALETRIMELARTASDYVPNDVDDALSSIGGALAETLYCSVERMMEYEAEKDAALTELARYRALMEAQNDYATDVSSREDFHRATEKGD